MTISPRVAAGARAAVIVAVVAAGAGAGGARASAPPTSEPAATDPAPTTPTATDVVVTSAAPATGESPWTEIVPGADCVCADAAEFSFFVRHADPKKVMFFLEGGVPASTRCRAPSARHLRLLERPQPFADYSVVYVPYCTGDVHVGDTTREYSPDLTVEHNGYVNGTTALGYL
ncbi:MAG: hypothetical protein M3431_11295, partial [Actinomycetota bacterium]|nr:hypothetical protein [Actinomycetota bacterium]